jgi:hypothetical protein
MRLTNLFSVAVLVFGSFASVGSTNVLADTFSNTYLGAGVQTPSSTNYFETFDGNFNGTTNFNGSSITGTYSGTYRIVSSNKYGGAGGDGSFITTRSSYTLTLSSQVNYFGMWFSALDAGNQLSFYNNDNLVFSFSPSDYAALVGACPTMVAQPNFCGNPNGSFSNLNANEQYAYLNFYDTDGSFNKIVFTENPQVGGFESDNHAVAQIHTQPGGTPLSPVPEPSSFVLGLSGLSGLVGLRHRLVIRIRD